MHRSDLTNREAGVASAFALDLDRHIAHSVGDLRLRLKL